MKSIFILSVALVLSACSTHKSTSKSDTPQKISDAVTAPLKDLNLIKTAIPAPLRNAQKNPYAIPADASCTALAKEINALNEVLGTDLDAPASDKDESLLARINVVDESVSAIRKTTEGAVPFRNWVRKLSGAERKSKAVAAAITAGSIRRAYLKGIGQANNCQAPAAPNQLTAKP
jgi:hypothetical protein